MPFAERLYEWGIRAGRELLPRSPVLPEKLRVGIERRKGLLDRIERWAREARPDGRLIWFHAPSVGEGLQTQPVIEALKELRPDLQIFYTFFPHRRRAWVSDCRSITRTTCLSTCGPM